MIGARPDFLDSPYFVMEEDNWHLKPGAPAEIVKEFNEYMGIKESPRETKKSLTDQINELLHG